MEVGEIRHRAGARREEDVRHRRGVVGRRSASSSFTPDIFPALATKSLNSPIRAAVRAEQDPERRRRRPPGDREDLARRGLALPGRRDQPPRLRRGLLDGLGLGRGRAAAADVAGRVGLPRRMAGPQDQPRRHAGRPGFQADTLASLRVVEGALFAVNGVNGVEVQTTRLWERARGARPLPRPLRDHARPGARGLFHDPRAAPGASSPNRCVAVQIPIGPRARAEGDRRPLPHARVHGSERRARVEPGRHPR